MKSHTMRIVGVVVTLGVGWGCLSPVPIDPAPRIAVDRGLLGRWGCQTALPEPETEKAVLTVAAAGPNEYSLVLDDPEMGVERYNAYASELAGLTLFNIQSGKDGTPLEPHPWVFGRAHQTEANVLKLSVVNWQAPAGALSQFKLREVLAERAKRPNFLTDIGTCTRMRRP